MPERPVAPHDHTRFSRGGRLSSLAITGLTTSNTGASGGAEGGVTDHGALTGLADDDHSAYVTVVGGGGETVYTVAASGTATTVDSVNGNIHDITLTGGTVVFTLTSPTAGVGCALTLLLRQDGTGGRLVTWPGSVDWPGASAPTLGTAAGELDVVSLVTTTGGTAWLGFHATGGGVSYATPSIALGTAAAAGAASTVIRSDSTIAAFSTAVPTTQAYSDVASAGTAAFAARRDHLHGMPASGSGIGEILISDTPSTPLVFADLVQNEAEDDLVYADP